MGDHNEPSRGNPVGAGVVVIAALLILACVAYGAYRALAAGGAW